MGNSQPERALVYQYVPEVLMSACRTRPSGHCARMRERRLLRQLSTHGSNPVVNGSLPTNTITTPEPDRSSGMPNTRLLS